jgi:hypothetical protein
MSSRFVSVRFAIMFIALLVMLFTGVVRADGFYADIHGCATFFGSDGAGSGKPRGESLAAEGSECSSAAAARCSFRLWPRDTSTHQCSFPGTVMGHADLALQEDGCPD